MLNDFEFVVDDAHFEYLVIQRGAVSDFRHDRAQWLQAYKNSVLEIYRNIAGAIPSECNALLDIGSGLGGIDAVLSKHYGGRLEVFLLDGKESEARVVQRDLPFSSAEVARDFQAKNGVANARCIGPNDVIDSKFDLIVSFAAYAFHIAPSVYLDRVMQACKPTTVCIFDVRTARLDWLEELKARFARYEVILTAKKYERIAFYSPL